MQIYLPQPVLPVIAAEFGLSETAASLAISAVILGIALANLPFGNLSDRYPIRPIIVLGGAAVAAGGLICALTHDYRIFIAGRFLQGLFFPALTTCVAAHLANNLPLNRLNVAMGWYVAATVIGGLGGRLIGGLVHPPLHWRHAFVTASLLLLVAVLAGARGLPQDGGETRTRPPGAGYLSLLASGPVLRIFAVSFGSFWVFSAAFTYLPFYLSGTPFNASTGVITLTYLVYLSGIAAGPLAGRIANRQGHGLTMVLGALVFAMALLGTLINSWIAIVLSLAAICAGFFGTHAAASGALNSRVTSGRGRANALYVLCYYAGGALGILASGYAYARAGWTGVVVLGVVMLLLPVVTGALEMRSRAVGASLE